MQDEQELDAAVDGELVAAEVRAIEPIRVGSLPVAQTAAVAVTGFAVGAATVVVVRGRRPRKAGRRSKKRRELGRIVSSRSFLLDVHLLDR